MVHSFEIQLHRRNPSLALLFFLGISLGAAALALPPEKGLTQYAHHSWGKREGLAQDTIEAIAQTPDGYLWLGSHEGVIRFDGHRFTVFSRQAASELGGGPVRALLVDRTGRLWIGTANGLLEHDGGRFEHHGPESGLPRELVIALHEDRRGRLWAGTTTGASVRDGGRFRSVTAASGFPRQHVHGFAEDEEGSLWMATSRGVAEWRDLREIRRLTRADGLANDVVRDVHVDSSGDLWCATLEGLTRFADGQAMTFTTRNGLPSNTIRKILEDEDGNLWVGSNGGLSRLRDGRFESMATARGVTNNLVMSLFEDRDGSLWIGSQNDGLSRLRDGAVTPFGVPEGLARSRVRSLYEDSRENLWLGTDGGGLYRRNAGELSRFTTSEGLVDDSVYATLEDREGALWVGTAGGLSRFAEGRFTTFRSRDGLINNVVLALHEDRDGALWIGTNGGLSVFRDGEFSSFTTADGLSSDVVRVFAEDARGRLWMGTSGGGLISLEEGEFVVFDSRNGLASDLILSLWAEIDGTLWVGTDGGGLMRFRDDRWTIYDERTGLDDLVVNAILGDGRGHLWYLGNQGVYRLDETALEAVALAAADPGVGDRDTSELLDPLLLNGLDGMRSIHGSGGVQSAGVLRHDGSLWFATSNGTARVDPPRLTRRAEPPPLILEEISIDGRPVIPPSRVVMEPDGENLEIRFTAIDLVYSERLSFRYRLEGLDKDWIDAGSRRVAYYSHPRPGQYLFQVAVREGAGRWGEAIELATIEVEPAIYETWGFLLAMLALLALGGLGLYRIRVRQLVDHNLELVRIRRELERKNAELERFAYAVSHDLKSPLFTIQGYLGFLEDTARRGQWEAFGTDLGRIRGAATQMGQSLDQLLELSRLGHKEPTMTNVSLTDVVEEALERTAGRIREHGCQVVVTSDLPSVFGDHSRLVEVVQNLIENAAKYMGRQEQPTIEIGAMRHGKDVLCHVRDNGIGIDPRYHETVFGLFDKLDATSTGSGVGLSLVHRIVTLHGGRIWVESEGSSQGSTFLFTLPASPT